MSPHPVDTHVGKRLRLRRTILGISQEALAKSVGITFQQVQKYERGVNRMSASRLHEFGHVLGVPVSYFYESMENKPGDYAQREPAVAAAAESDSVFEHEDIAKRETLEMMRAYYRIPPAARKKIAEMIKALAEDKAVVE